MNPTVPASTLLRGALFALEQCGLLLEDAVILFDRSRFATAAGIALLAREELGRHTILLELWRKTTSGHSVTVAAVIKACDDHETKQRRAQLSVTLRIEGETKLGQLFRAQMESAPGSEEYEKAETAFRLSWTGGESGSPVIGITNGCGRFMSIC